MRKTIDQKARRLVDDERVHRIPAETFAVRGDGGTYLVIKLIHDVVDDVWTCDCPYEGSCSHIRAAKLKAAT